MVCLATALFLTLPQGVAKPSTVVRPDTAGYGEVVLEGGESIAGEILKETANYIEIRIDGNMVVGFDRSRVTSIVRRGQEPPPTKTSMLNPRDEWYVLHGGDGRAVGHLHGLVQTQENGDIHLTEEWLFTGKKGSTQITLVEVVDQGLDPKSCFYHERVNDKSGRLIAETIRRGTLQGRRLLVNWRSLHGQETRAYQIEGGIRFPLAFREELRQHDEIAIHQANQQIFDAKTGSFKALRASTVQSRKVSLGQRVMVVRELLIEDGDQKNSEWIDVHCNVQRREINGPALVGLKSTKDRAMRSGLNANLRGSGSALVTSADGQFGMWMPNPVWSLDTRHAGSVTAQATLFGASASLVELSHLQSYLHLTSATDAVIRWLRLSVGKGIRVEARRGVEIRRLPAVELQLQWQIQRVGESTPFRGSCHVFRCQNRFFAFLFTAPRDHFETLQADAARILASVQLTPEELAPEPRGPLAKPGR
jgi:hypothetical protein